LSGLEPPSIAEKRSFWHVLGVLEVAYGWVRLGRRSVIYR